MKINLLIIILIAIFSFLKCDKVDKDTEVIESPNNINIESISYELSYTDHSVIKVVIKTYDEIEADISFIAYLKSENEKKEYLLNCSNSFYDIIECHSERNVTFNLEDKYYFYYNKTKSKITFDENDILEDDKRVSLLFKPEITIDEKIYKDNRKIIVSTNNRMVGGGVLYIARKSKKLLQKLEDGFNKFIELNNFISHVGLFSDMPQSTYSSFNEAIIRGYHIVDADLQFTKDKVPVICHEENLENFSNGKGTIESKTLEELLKLDFGSKVNKKYEGEKILTFEGLLQLCKENNAIIDLNLEHLDYNKYFESTNEYMKIIIQLVEHYGMIDSIIFNDGPNPNTILKLKGIRNDISVSISNIKTKEDIDKIKDKYTGSKRIIYNFGEITKDKNIDENAVKYALSLGKKVKVGNVDDLECAQKLFSSGVNFITTKKLHPFLIKNEKQDPVIVRCSPIDDDSSECDIDDDLALKDNEFYNIYYTDNIYNLSSNINNEPIGDFQYIDTNLLDEMYYAVRKFDFEKGIIELNLSHEIENGEQIFGIVGPAYENAAECYQYNFVCHGKGIYFADCKIEKNDEYKIHFNGTYCIYSVEDYSLNQFEIEEKKKEEKENEQGYVQYIVEEKTSYFFVFIITVVIILIIIIIYFVKCRKPAYYNAIRDSENNFMPDDYLYR